MSSRPDLLICDDLTAAMSSQGAIGPTGGGGSPGVLGVALPGSAFWPATGIRAGVAEAPKVQIYMPKKVIGLMEDLHRVGIEIGQTSVTPASIDCEFVFQGVGMALRLPLPKSEASDFSTALELAALLHMKFQIAIPVCTQCCGALLREVPLFTTIDLECRACGFQKPKGQ